MGKDLPSPLNPRVSMSTTTKQASYASSRYASQRRRESIGLSLDTVQHAGLTLSSTSSQLLSEFMHPPSSTGAINAQDTHTEHHIQAGNGATQAHTNVIKSAMPPHTTVTVVGKEGPLSYINGPYSRLALNADMSLSGSHGTASLSSLSSRHAVFVHKLPVPSYIPSSICISMMLFLSHSLSVS
jgi:hypothetical protein